MIGTPRKRTISKRPIPGRRLSGGVGYLIIPEDIDRDVYISNSIRIGAVSFLTENGERFDNIKIAKSVFNDLVFPEKPGQLGSFILWMLIPKRKIPVIIGILNNADEMINLSEGQFILEKTTKDAHVEISGDGKNGRLFINVENLIKRTTKDDGGELIINVKNQKGTGKVKFIVDGEIDIDVGNTIKMSTGKKLLIRIADPVADILAEDEEDKITEISYERGVGLIYKDEFGNEIIANEENIKLTANENINIIANEIINLGTGKEALALGDTLKKELEKEKARLTALIDAIKQAAVAPGDGGTTFKANIIASISTVTAGNYDKILSEKTKTD